MLWKNSTAAFRPLPILITTYLQRICSFSRSCAT